MCINYAISLETGELKNHHRSQVNDFVYIHACVHIATVSYPDPAPFNSLHGVGSGNETKVAIEQPTQASFPGLQSQLTQWKNR